MSDERISEAEYLVRERAAEYRSEYRDGRMVALAGATRTHGLIATNVALALGTQTGGRGCTVIVADMRVKVASTGLYAYPDVVALCGDPAFEDAREDTLLNPAVIVEVLSRSTEANDRGEKFAHYRQIDSLRQYVLIAQDRMRVERYARDEADPERWTLTALDTPDAVLDLRAIGCAVPLREIYDQVRLASSAGPAPGN